MIIGERISRLFGGLSYTNIFGLLAAVLLVAGPDRLWAADFEKGADAYSRADYAEALRQWQPLAQQGDEIAAFRLGNMYYDGLGVYQNLGTAAKYYTLAAKRGHAAAQVRLGDMYSGGWGVRRSAKTAEFWWRAAIEKGNADAALSLGVMYSKKRVNAKDCPETMRNLFTAEDWFQLASQLGNQNAARWLTQLQRRINSIKAQHNYRSVCVE